MNKLNPLTSLRFFAALAVFMHHVATISFFSNGNLHYMESIFYEGNIGVGFFYILSGFIISYSYRDKILSGKIKNSEFILYRLARLYPVHMLTFIIAFYVYNGSQNLPDPTLLKAVGNLLLVQSWVPSVKSAFSFNGVAWSISVEMFFYASFLGVVFLRLRSLIIILVSLLFVILLMQKINYMNISIDRIWLFYINPVFRLVDFLSGVIIFHLYSKIKNMSLGFYLSTFLEIISILMLVITIGLKHKTTLEMRLDLYYIVPMSLIISVFAISNGVMEKLLSVKPLIFLGEASFSFYMIHQIVFNYYLLNIPFHMRSVGDFINSTAIIFVVSLVFAVVIYVCYEKPMNSYIRKLIKRAKNNSLPTVNV